MIDGARNLVSASSSVTARFPYLRACQICVASAGLSTAEDLRPKGTLILMIQHDIVVVNTWLIVFDIMFGHWILDAARNNVSGHARLSSPSPEIGQKPIG
jgi:hypothetical protein